LSPKIAFIPLPWIAVVATSAAAFGPRGSCLLTAQIPPIACSDKRIAGVLGDALVGGTALPLSSGAYAWHATRLPPYLGRHSPRCQSKDGSKDTHSISRDHRLPPAERKTATLAKRPHLWQIVERDHIYARAVEPLARPWPAKSFFASRRAQDR